MCLLAATPAAADTFKPTRFGDPPPGKCKPHDCSLREAFLAANKHEGHDSVPLDRGTYRIELPPDEGAGEDGGWWAYDVSIRGKGPKKTKLDANGLDSVMQLGNFDERNSLEAVKITGGNSSDQGAVGGIYGTGTKLTLKHVVLADNHTSAGGGGGAVLAPRKKSTVADVKVVGNSAASGGGLYVAPGSAGITKATIRDSEIRDNTSSFGGGVYSNILELTVERTTIAENQSTEGGGMALVSYFNNLSNPRPSTGVFASTISGNTATKGGGILADGNQPTTGGLKQVVEVQNSTVAGNETAAEGGGIMADNGVAVNIDHATVAHNTADPGMTGDNGGGVLQHGGASFGLTDSLIAANVVGTSGAGSQCAGAFQGAGGNVVQLQSGTLCSISGGAITEPVDAMIGPLADNGGPTETVALLPGSAAIGFAVSCPAVDQRGVPRPAEDCDSGAFELEGP